MTRAAFTPGPWHVKPSRSDGDELLEVNSNSRHITLHMIEAAEDIANARLIAAAPELLQACEDAEQFTRGFDIDESQPSVKWLSSQLRAAIAKAKGGAA